MKKLSVLLLAICLIFGVSAPAAAKGFGAGVKLGYSVPLGDFGDNADGAVAYGVYGEYVITPNIAVESAFVRHAHNLAEEEQVSINGMIGSVETSADATINELTANGRFSLPMGRVTPFVTAGLGLYFWEGSATAQASGFGISASESVTEDGTDIGFNTGGGASIAVHDQISVGGEVIFHYIFGDFDDSYINFLTRAAFHFSSGRM